MLTDPLKFLILMMVCSLVLVGVGWEEPMYNNPELYK